MENGEREGERKRQKGRQEDSIAGENKAERAAKTQQSTVARLLTFNQLE